jgi:hypothetical protein
MILTREKILMFLAGCGIFCGILLATILLVAIFDAIIIEPYQLENATIDGIKQSDIFYVYELNISGSKAFVSSVNYYNMSDNISVYVQRGAISHAIMSNVVINGAV